MARYLPHVLQSRERIEEIAREHMPQGWEVKAEVSLRNEGPERIGVLCWTPDTTFGPIEFELDADDSEIRRELSLLLKDYI